MLYIVGLGLGDERDITLRGLDAVRKCERVYLEAYTSLLALGLGASATTTLEKLYGRPVVVADREMVEQMAERILEEALVSDVAFLVVGDPFGVSVRTFPVPIKKLFTTLSTLPDWDPQHTLLTSGAAFGSESRATTHSDLLVRAKSIGVKVEVIHNASVMNAVGACGLQLYRFGEAISIPFFTETWRPDSFYDKIKSNRSMGLHTLCLLDDKRITLNVLHSISEKFDFLSTHEELDLHDVEIVTPMTWGAFVVVDLPDIRVKEPSVEALCRGRKEYEPPRYMSVNTAVEQLIEIEESRQENAYTESTMAVGIARLGSPDQLIVAGHLKDLLEVDFGPPLHCLIITGTTHVMEEEMLNFFKVQK